MPRISCAFAAPVFGLLGVLLLSSLGGVSPSTVPHPAAPSAPAAAAPRAPVAFGPSSARATPHGSPVNPYLFHTSEPAPLAMADYGLSGDGGTYSYRTPIFRGVANVSELEVNASSTGYMTFQLNVELLLVGPKGNLTYWVQDVVSIESQADYIDFLDNIWNLSSAGASFQGGELSGNGSIGPAGSVNFYGDSPAPGSLPGNGISWHAPGTVEVQVVSSVDLGLPHVAFEYSDGYGWITYDNVTFLKAGGYSDYGFYVTGANYTPSGLFYDAEWDFTGPGGPATDSASNLSLELQYWNGHNLQEPRSAWNFGTNTGETISNVRSDLTTVPISGTLLAQETNGPNGALGPLYGAAQASTLTVLLPSGSSGTVTVGGVSTPYVGAEANLTLAPGAYPVAAYDLNGSLIGRATVTLEAGSPLLLTLPLPEVSFGLDLLGLPAGSPVAITLGCNFGSCILPSPSEFRWNTSVADDDEHAVLLPTGSFLIGFAGIPGYVLRSYTIGAIVSGSSSPLVVSWMPFTYPVAVTASGLPGGTAWGVDLSGLYLNGTGSPLGGSLPNGSHPYWVFDEGPYDPSPQSGVLWVNASDASLQVNFTLQPGRLLGTLSPVNAVLELDGATEPLDNGTYLLHVLAGTYTLTASASGYVSLSRTVSVTPGNATFTNFTLAASSGSGATHSSSSAGVPVLGLTLIAVGGVAGASIAALLLRRRR
jgi:hypothetical protein